MSKAMREIERRFLARLSMADLSGYAFAGLKKISTEYITQHYIAKSGGNTVRLRRIIKNGKTTFVICVKGSGDGINEVENRVSASFAKPFMDGLFNTQFIEKTRVTFDLGYLGLKLEIDFFHGDLSGLVIAEIEIPHESFQIPNEIIPTIIGPEMDVAQRLILSNYALAMLSSDERKRLLIDLGTRR